LRYTECSESNYASIRWEYTGCSEGNYASNRLRYTECSERYYAVVDTFQCLISLGTYHV
jgi:hypothetical protein